MQIVQGDEWHPGDLICLPQMQYIKFWEKAESIYIFSRWAPEKFKRFFFLLEN